MRIVQKPYQVVLQYGCEIGETAGALRGVSLATMQFGVADDSEVIEARLDRGKEDHPKDFPREELAKLLGSQFETFEGQLREAKEGLAEKSAAAEILQISEGQLKEQLKVATDTIAGLQQKYADLIAYKNEMEKRHAKVLSFLHGTDEGSAA